MCSLYIHIIHIAPNEEELAGSSRGCQSKHQLQIVSERSAWRPQGQARQSERNCWSDHIQRTLREKKRERKPRFKSGLFWLHTTVYVCSSCDFGLNTFPSLHQAPFFSFLLANTFLRTVCRTVQLCGTFGGGDVFPATRLPAVPKCLPSGVREREAGSSYAFVPGREHRDWGKSVRHRSGGYIGVGHVRQPVRT